jgi:hypothetical protein
MDQGFGGGEGTAENFRNFLVTEFILAAEKNGGALGFRQIGEGGFDFSLQFTMEQLIHWERTRFIFVLALGLVLVLGMGFVQGLGGVPGTTPDLIETEVPGDGEKPGGKLGGLLVPLSRFVDLQKHILREIFGFCFIAQVSADEIEEGLLVFSDQFTKRRSIAAFNVQHEGGIKVGWFRHGRLSLFNAAKATRFRFL